MFNKECENIQEATNKLAENFKLDEEYNKKQDESIDNLVQQVKLLESVANILSKYVQFDTKEESITIGNEVEAIYSNVQQLIDRLLAIWDY